jgi:hypothetical protein
LLGWRGARNCRRADRRFCCEQGFGRLACSGDPLAIVAARMRLVLSAKQELLRKVIDTRDRNEIRQVWQGPGRPVSIREPENNGHRDGHANQAGRRMARTKAVTDRTMAATMAPALTSPAGVVRTVAFNDTPFPTRNATLALISSECVRAPAGCCSGSVGGSYVG